MEEIIMRTTSTQELVDKIVQELKKNGFVALTPKEENHKAYLTRKEVADLCGIKSLSTLWYWKKQGLLTPSANAGRKPLYKYEDVLDFIENRKGGQDV